MMGVNEASYNSKSVILLARTNTPKLSSTKSVFFSVDAENLAKTGGRALFNECVVPILDYISSVWGFMTMQV